MELEARNSRATERAQNVSRLGAQPSIVFGIPNQRPQRPIVRLIFWGNKNGPHKTARADYCVEIPRQAW
jgi:hypothetical protein